MVENPWVKDPENRQITFPDRETRKPNREIAFPDREMGNPDSRSGDPRRLRETAASDRFPGIRGDRCVVQDQQPAVVFKNKDVSGVCLCAVDLVAVGGGDAFQAGNPGGRSLNFDRNLRDIDPHEGVRASKHLFPARTDVFPSR